MKTCFDCGNPAAPNRSRCSACLARAAEYHKQYAKQRKVEGRCLDCNAPVMPDGTYCVQCREHRNALARKRYRERTAKGICPTCGQPSASGVLCTSCHEQNRSYHKQRMARSLRNQIIARDENQCSLCGSTTKLHVHHRNGSHVRTDVEALQDDPDNHPDNLITLCHTCHSALTHLSRVYNQGLLHNLLKELK